MNTWQETHEYIHEERMWYQVMPSGSRCKERRGPANLNRKLGIHNIKVDRSQEGKTVYILTLAGKTVTESISEEGGSIIRNILRY